MLKKCNSCFVEKPFLEFSKDSRAKDGLCYYCRLCRKDQKKKEYNTNKDKILQKCKEYRIKNSEKLNSSQVEYRTKNRQSIRIKQNEIYQKNKEERLDCARKRYAENKEVIKARVKSYTKENRSKINAIKAKYRAARYNATPDWLTKEHLVEIEEFYTLAYELAWLNEGEILQVDHIVPLQGKTVCGLHVPWNLQILTKSNNISKFNKLVSS
jgi:hypothetical protein